MSNHLTIYTHRSNKIVFAFCLKGEYAIAKHFQILGFLSPEEVSAAICDFITYIQNEYLTINYIVNYPGTQNPVFVKAMLQSVNSLELDYRIWHNNNLWNDSCNNFIHNCIDNINNSSLNWECAPQDGRCLECSICASIRSNCNDFTSWRN